MSNPVMMQAFLNAVEQKCVRVSWGDYDGMQAPKLADLYALRGLLDGAIEEARAAMAQQEKQP